MVERVLAKDQTGVRFPSPAPSFSDKTMKITRRILISAPRDSVEQYLSGLGEAPRRKPKVERALRKMDHRVTLRPVNGGTLVVHDEGYVLPFYLRPLRAFVRRWLDHALETELDAIKEGAEALNRRAQLARLDA